MLPVSATSSTRILDPRFVSHLASHDVGSDVRQALPPGRFTETELAPARGAAHGGAGWGSAGEF